VGFNVLIIYILFLTLFFYLVFHNLIYSIINLSHFRIEYSGYSYILSMPDRHGRIPFMLFGFNKFTALGI